MTHEVCHSCGCKLEPEEKEFGECVNCSLMAQVTIYPIKPKPTWRCS